MSFYYLASPYSDYQDGRIQAYRDVCEQAALLAAAGVPVFCPIAMTHGMAQTVANDSHEFWMVVDRPFMEAACGLIVCKLAGWETSRGVTEEVQYFKNAGKPVYYMELDEVPSEVLPKARQIIALCGYAGVGKDTASRCLIDVGWTRVAFADAVREAALALNPIVTFSQMTPESLSELVADVGWEAAKNFIDVRTTLQRMGTEAGRNIHGQDCWIKIAKRKIDAAPGNVVLTDCRFQGEAEAVRSWGGKVIRIDRPGVGPVNGHSSEELDFEPDAVIVNDGTIAWLQTQLYSGASCFADAQGSRQGSEEGASV